ncbi:MAG: peptidylprolyl isomerase [Lysobacterales bacterium]
MPLSAVHARARAGAIVLTLGLGLTACQPSPEDTVDAPTVELQPGEIARSGSLSVDRQALDQFVLRRLQQERPVPGADLSGWYRERIREYLIEADLLQTARARQLDQTEEFQSARASVRREQETDLCLRQKVGQLPPVQRSDLQAEFDRHADQFQRPERRLTLHYYRRASDAAAIHAASTELTTLRERVLQGEDFRRLARAGSDSESRHRDGELGWLSRGELPTAIDVAVFALDEGVPSQPLTTADGVHLFMVESIAPARRATLIEALPALRERLLLERLEPTLQASLASDTDDYDLPDDATLATLLRESDGSDLLLQDGDFQLSVADFRRHLARVARRESGQGLPGDPPTLLRALRNREKLRRACQAEGWLADSAVAAAVKQWEDQRLLELQRRETLRALAEEDEQRLRLFHDQNPDQFSTPVRWSLRRLRIALDASASTTMAKLEAAAASGEQDLIALQAQVGGEIDELPRQRGADLRRISPTLPALIAPLQPDQLSPPLRTREHLQIFQLLSREDPQPADFESARERVISNFVRYHAADLYRRHAERLFARQPLQIDPDGLQELVSGGLPQTDISPEALDQLLEAL